MGVCGGAEEGHRGRGFWIQGWPWHSEIKRPRVFLQDSRIILLRIEELEKELKETSGPLVTPSGDRRCEIYQLSSLDVLGWVSRVLGQTIHESLEWC